jgi:Xaa-Pro aminopeptidase
MTGQQADALARDVAEAAGHGEHYLHGLGHGLGLEIHESPALSKYAEEQTLEPGMVFSIEPGIYVSGWGGVRVEDTVVLTDNGVRVLTASHKRFALLAR